MEFQFDKCLYLLNRKPDMSNKLAHFLEDHYQPCAIKQCTGVDCPGCGMQRSFHALLEGDILETVHQYPALLPLIGMFLFLILHLVFKFKNGAQALMVMFIANVAIILINYLAKLTPLFL